MRSLLLFLSLVVAGSVVHAQRTANGPVQDRVLELSRSGVAFQQVRLFQRVVPSRSTDALWNAACTKASVLGYDAAAARVLFRTQAPFISLEVPSEEGTRILDLERVEVTASGFLVRTSSGDIAAVPSSAHYRGVVRGVTGSLAAISVYEDEVMGIIGEGADDMVLGRLGGDAEGRHVLYHENDLRRTSGSVCGTRDLPVSSEAQETRIQDGADRTMRCVHIYWESAFDLFQNKGSVANVTTYLTGLFNQMATLYANDGVDVLLQEIFVWNTASPYDATSSSGRLGQFGTTRTSFNGDLAHLIDLGGYGGVAWLNTLCAGTSSRMAYSGINTTFQGVPTYSWSVEVVTHETGHNLGSRHTHACAWNGNATAIDGCGPAAGYVEGTCPAGPVPSSAVGGTIMSYCHLVSAGIKFANGFGPQPGQVIRDRVNGSTCLLACGSSCDAPTPLGTTNLTPTSATLTWGNVGAVSYDLRWKPTASGTWTNVNALVATTHGISGLTQQTAYEFQVRSNCTSATSAYSASYTFTTPTPCPDVQEPNNSTATAQLVTAPLSLSALIASAGDVDYYRFVLASTGNVNINLGSLPADYDVRLLNSSGTQLAISQNGGTSSESISYPNAAPGSYYIHVYGYNGAFNIYTCYFLSLYASVACTPPDGVQVSGIVYNGATITWAAVTGATSYDLRWKPTSGSTWSDVPGIVPNSYGLGGLQSLTGYDVQVRTNCGGVQGGSASQYTATTSFTTSAAPCEVSPPMRVAVKVFLEGPYKATPFAMADSLRVLGLLPQQEPYTALGYTMSTTVSTTPTVLATTGANAPVDWVVVELRNASTPTTIVEARAGLLQRDGDVVAADGVSPLFFCSVAGNYYVAVRHRNHLACMSMQAIMLNSTATTVDFTLAATNTYGTNARKTVGSVRVLWAGNVLVDGILRYTGETNDRDPILQAVGGAVPTNTVGGYLLTDVNMDGKARYVGVNNDRDPILSNIGGSVPTNTLFQQLP